MAKISLEQNLATDLVGVDKTVHQQPNSQNILPLAHIALHLSHLGVPGYSPHALPQHTHRVGELHVQAHPCISTAVSSQEHPLWGQESQVSDLALHLLTL